MTDVGCNAGWRSDMRKNRYSDCDLLQVIANLSGKASLEDFPDDEKEIVLAQLDVLRSRDLIEGDFTFPTEPDDTGRILAVDGDNFNITEEGRKHINVSC